MPKATLEGIIEEVKTLTPDEQRQLREILNQATRSAEPGAGDQLAKSIRGKYVDVLTSSEEFNRRKAEEIALEECR